MSKKLIAYFSASGVTAKAAEKLAAVLDAPVYEISPQTPYTPEDLNWRDPNSRSSVEMKDKAFRPPLADLNADVADCDTVFVGFPIWWYVAPTIINTFLEAYDFSGKKIVLFATSGSSGFGKTLEELKPSVADSAQLIEGALLSKMTDDEIAAWAKSLNV